MTISVRPKRLESLHLIPAMLALALTGAIAGFFYAYSSSVMRGLDAADPVHAIRAMQGINSQVRNAFFAPAFFGAPVACAIAAVGFALRSWRLASSAMAAAAAIYFCGALLPTFLINVPMNEALSVATVPASDEAQRQLWLDYSMRWTTWNHIRTGFSFVSLLLVGTAIHLAGRR